jgi:hypothetical protein
VMEASSRVLGEEHPDTLSAMASLAATYRKQGRWQEAEELFVKVIETRSRVLGEEHPNTLNAMANLAYTKRDLGQSDLAIDLMTRSATISSKVLGYEHPDCRSRNERAALWSSLTTNDDGDGVDWDINQSVHSDGGGCVDV